MIPGCDGCSATGLTLVKVSLTRDFFGDIYDRLTPASDRAPAWYCPNCSEEKHMQTDFRLIAAAWVRHRSGEGSPLDDTNTCRRAHDRLQKIAARLSGEPFPQRLIHSDEVSDLCKEIDSVGCP